MNKVLVALEGDGLIELHAVLLDDDPVAALEFLKRHIAPQIPQKGTAACDSSRLNPFLLPGRLGEGILPAVPPPAPARPVRPLADGGKGLRIPPTTRSV